MQNKTKHGDANQKLNGQAKQYKNCRQSWGTTHRGPPKGIEVIDSQRCLSTFLDFYRFLMIFLENQCFIYESWAGMVGDESRIYFRVFLSSGTSPKTTFWSPNLRFSLFQTPFLKTSIFIFRPKLTFWVTNLQIHAVQNVPMDRTDHFGFQ